MCILKEINGISKEKKPFEYEAMFQQAFLDMKTMVEELYKEWKKNEEGKIQGNGEGGGNDPPETPPSLSSPSSSSSSSIPQKKQPEKTNSNLPTVKLDVKFYFPMHNGELNEKKFYHWIIGSTKLKYIAVFRKLWMKKKNYN